MLIQCRHFRFACVALLTLVIAGALAPQEARKPPQSQPRRADRSRLSAEGKAQLAEVLRLKKLLGGPVWPGFDRAEIPLILYTQEYEWLVGHAEPPMPWTVVEADDFQGRRYHRRPADNPQAFAAAVGQRWAGSLGTLEHMNQTMRTEVSKRLSPAAAKLLGGTITQISPQQHACALLHESFHAFQATADRGRFLAADATHAAEGDYPFDDPDFKAAWDKEGRVLTAAVSADDNAERLRLIRQFLELRDARRGAASLSAATLAFERELEWLEGLAKYVEQRFCELAAAQPNDPAAAAYRSGLSRAQWDAAFRMLRLGRLKGDTRFYLSGQAQARLLDQVDAGWKTKVLREGVFLEDLLRAALPSTGR